MSHAYERNKALAATRVPPDAREAEHTRTTEAAEPADRTQDDNSLNEPRQHQGLDECADPSF